MANDTIILSPEYAGNTGRREVVADAAIKPGNLISYTATGCDVSTAAGARQMVALENVSIAGDVATNYAAAENVHAAFLPSGARVKVTAAAATYADGALLEIAASGRVTAVSAGTAVAVVPAGAGAIIGTNDGLLVVELL
jgi:hypothetical protein